MTSRAKLTVAPLPDTPSDLPPAQAPCRLMLRCDRDAHLIRWMEHRAGGDRVVAHGFPGVARFGSGARVWVQEAEGWPGALLGFRRSYDTELVPVNAAGEALMRSWLPRIHDDVFAWIEGDAVAVFRAAQPCPICGHRTLTEPMCYEICAVCGWEDDGWARERPDVRSGPNHTTPAEARRGHWERLGTTRERARWRSLDPAPTLTADDHAEAMGRVLRLCVTRPETRAAMRAALRRIRPTPERRALALASAWDGAEREADRACVFAHLDAALPLLIERPDHGGDDALAAQAALAGLDVRDALRARAQLLDMAGALGWAGGRLRALEARDVERLASAEDWARLELLAELGWLRDRAASAPLSAELDAWAEEPDWERWCPLGDEARARFAWARVWDAPSREAFRARVVRAIQDDEGCSGWLFEDIAALVGVPYPPDEGG